MSMEKNQEVDVVQVNYECPNCIGTYMEFTGRVQLLSPPLYIHQCPKCDFQKSLSKEYPYVKYVPVP